MKNYIFMIVGVLAILFGGFYFTTANAQKAESGLQVSKVSIALSDGKIHEFDVELALTQDEQAYGLMNRKSLPKNAGMLFVFGEEKEIAFYMKDTLIPLDMIFIKKSGEIGYIYENATPLDETPILSNGAVFAVLEINGGMSSKLGIKKGDVVKSEFLKK